MNILIVSSIPRDPRMRFGDRFPDQFARYLNFPIFYFRSINVGFYYLDFVLGILLCLPSFLWQSRKVDTIVCFIPYLLPFMFLTRKKVILVAVDDYEGGVYRKSFKRKVFQLYREIYFPKCKAVICTIRGTISKLRYYNPNVILLRVGVETDIFCPREVNNKIPILHYHGKLRSDYYVGMLIDALIYIKNPVVLHLVGDGPEFEKLQKKAGNLPVVFLGKRPYSEIPSLTQQADICLLPIHLLSTKFYQYCACAKPVIGLAGQVTDEIASDRHNIWCVEENAEAFAEAVDFLLDHQEIRVNLGKNARKMILKQSWPAIVRRAEKILELSQKIN